MKLGHKGEYMAEKKNSNKTQTKAGMLGEKGSQTEDKKNDASPDKDRESTPKISKNEAEGQHDDRPIH